MIEINKSKIIKKLTQKTPDLMNKHNFLVSAVLLPIIEGNNGPEILFEVRSMKLDRQPGEICLPGGKVEADELVDPGIAAVREVSEELGLNKNDVNIISPLDFMVTPMGAVIYPYVGEILFPERIMVNREEVDRIFTVPLSFLLNNPPQVSSVEVATRYGEDFPLHRVPEKYRGGGWKKNWFYPTYIFEYENYFIWGMTAIILQHFLDKLRK